MSIAATPARPQGIAAAREGRPDNLQRISGIGPKTLDKLRPYVRIE